MKCIIIAMTVLVAFFDLRQASAARAFSEIKAYHSPLEEGQKLSPLQTADLDHFHQLLLDSGFVSLNERFGNGDTFFGVDQIFARFEDEKFIYFQMNIEPSDPSQLGELYKLDKEFVYHSKTANGLSYAVMFQNFFEHDLKSFVEEMNQWAGHKVSQRKSVFDVLFPVANAANHGTWQQVVYSPKHGRNITIRVKDGWEAVTDSKGVVVTDKGGIKVRRKILPSPTSQKSGSGKAVVDPLAPPRNLNIAEKAYITAVRCVCEAAMGFVQNTVGAAIKITAVTVRSIKDLVTNPIDFWKNAWTSLTGFMGRAGNSVKRAFNGEMIRDKNLAVRSWIYENDTTEKSADICNYGGQVGGAIFMYKQLAAPIKKAGRYVEKHVSWDNPQFVNWTKDRLKKIDHNLGIRVGSTEREAMRNIFGTLLGTGILSRIAENPREICSGLSPAKISIR